MLDLFQIPLAKIEKAVFKTPYPYSLRLSPSFCYFKPTLNFLKPELNCDFNMTIWYQKEIVDNNLVIEKKEKLHSITALMGLLNFRERYSESIKYEKPAFIALNKYYSKSEHLNLLIDLTESYSKLKSFNKAEEYYIKALTLVNGNKKSINKNFDTLRLFLLKASMHEDKKDYIQAEKIYWQSEKYIIDVLPIKDKGFSDNVKYKLCNLYKTKKINNTKNHNYEQICKEES